MRLFKKIALAAVASLLALPAIGQDFIAGIPRNEALIIQGPTAQNADWFTVVDQPRGRRRRLDQCAGDRAADL